MRPNGVAAAVANPQGTERQVPQTAVIEAAMRRPVVTAFVGLGANLGDAVQAVQSALVDLAQVPGIRALRASNLYRSAPVDATGPDFINAVAEVRTTLSAPNLLAALQNLELAAGRQRPYRNAPRTLDLDLLLYGQAQMHSPHLMLPHPRWLERAFVLCPLQELAPQLVRADMLAAVADQAVERMQLKAPSAP